MIYFDNAATTMRKPECVPQAVTEAMCSLGNSGRGVHDSALSASRIIYDTRAALMWDEEALYVGFWCEEPFPAATLTERDSLLWVENDLEVFIDGGDSYYELELNALNVVYEVFY